MWESSKDARKVGGGEGGRNYESKQVKTIITAVKWKERAIVKISGHKEALPGDRVGVAFVHVVPVAG